MDEIVNTQPAMLSPNLSLKVSEDLIAMMNKGLASELQVAIQYMFQHILWRGVKEFAVKDLFKKIAMQEMKHAELIAERIYYLGGTPTNEPDPRKIGVSLKEKIENDIMAEEQAILLYRQIIELAHAEKDAVTCLMFKNILTDEESHHDDLTTLYEEYAPVAQGV